MENSNWKQVPGGLKGISVGSKSVWGVNRLDQIYVDSTGKGKGNWTGVPGSLSQVSHLSPMEYLSGVSKQNAKKKYKHTSI